MFAQSSKHALASLRKDTKHWKVFQILVNSFCKTLFLLTTIHQKHRFSDSEIRLEIHQKFQRFLRVSNQSFIILINLSYVCPFLHWKTWQLIFTLMFTYTRRLIRPVLHLHYFIIISWKTRASYAALTMFAHFTLAGAASFYSSHSYNEFREEGTKAMNQWTNLDQTKRFQQLRSDGTSIYISSPETVVCLFRPMKIMHSAFVYITTMELWS